MTENLPVITASHDLTANKTPSTTLLGRGLSAIQNKKDQDKRYRQARDVYDRIAGDTWYEFDEFGYSTLATFIEFQSCLATFQSLADEGYCKAYFPLSVIYKLGSGELKNEKLAFHYAHLAFDWCFDNQSSDDPEIWSDLGVMYHWGDAVDTNQTFANSLLLKAAEQNNAQAQFFLGELYKGGEGIEKNFLERVFWYDKSVAQGYCNFGIVLGVLARFAAETGKEISSNDLGERYENDNSFDKDYKRAVYWYRLSADKGEPKGQYKLGWMYANGLGVEQDDEQAVFWYRKAAEQGYALAQYDLAGMYANGSGVEQNDDLAVFWYRKAAEQGDAYAQCNLGQRYAIGDGVEQDDEMAISCYYDAAQQGHVLAQYKLGFMYANGRGVEQDREQALFWYRKAAEQGHENAQCNLGFMFGDGGGVKQDYEQAVFWYRKAAEQGNALAQCNLGLMYDNGQGVESDFEQAVFWWRNIVDPIVKTVLCRV